MLNLLFLMAFSAMASEVPFDDNLLIAFEKCKTLNVDISEGKLIEASAPAFDLHCKVRDDRMYYQCEVFDPGSKERQTLESLRGGKDKNNIGTLRNAAGSFIRVSIDKKIAQYETPLMNDIGSIYGRKMCVGIFLFEKEALKKKRL